MSVGFIHGNVGWNTSPFFGLIAVKAATGLRKMLLTPGDIKH